jgi:hypothetical protein
VAVKRCSQCGELKPILEFNAKKARLDGHRAHCRACQSERWRKYGKFARHQDGPIYRTRIVRPARFQAERSGAGGSRRDGNKKNICYFCPMREICIPLAANCLPVMCEQIDDADVRMTIQRFGDAAPWLLGIADGFDMLRLDQVPPGGK